MLSTSGSGDSVLSGKDVAAHRAGYSPLHSFLLTRALIPEHVRLELIWFVLKKYFVHNIHYLLAKMVTLGISAEYVNAQLFREPNTSDLRI